MFANDFHDFGDVVFRIRAWAALGRASGQFHMARPKAIIVKQGAGPGPSPKYDLLELPIARRCGKRAIRCLSINS